MSWIRNLLRYNFRKKARKLLRRYAELQRIHGPGIREMKKIQAKLGIMRRARQ
jgi:hypothetical protein